MSLTSVALIGIMLGFLLMVVGCCSEESSDVETSVAKPAKRRKKRLAMAVPQPRRRAA